MGKTYIQKFNSVKELRDYYNKNQFWVAKPNCHMAKPYKLNWRKRIMQKINFRHVVFSILIFGLALFISDMSKSYKAEKSRNALYEKSELLYNQGMINKSQLLYTYVYK